MQRWRRGFATSIARLGHGPIAPIRCARVFQRTQKDGSSDLEDQELKLQGLIRSVRKQKKFAFAEISDGSTVTPLQAILTPSQAAECVSPSPLLLVSRALGSWIYIG